MCKIIFFHSVWYLNIVYLNQNKFQLSLNLILTNNSSCGRQKGPSMMTRYPRSYSLQKGPSLEDSVEYKVMNIIYSDFKEQWGNIFFYNTVNFQPVTFRILFFRGIQTLQMRLSRKACFWWTQLLRPFCRAADAVSSMSIYQLEKQKNKQWTRILCTLFFRQIKKKKLFATCDISQLSLNFLRFVFLDGYSSLFRRFVNPKMK